MFSSRQPVRRYYRPAEYRIIYSQFINNELETFLSNYSISAKYTDIFEETLLKLAVIKTKPACCHFGVHPDANSAANSFIHFDIEGISEEDAGKFLNFFKDCGDKHATHKANATSSHLFMVDAKVIYNEVFALFKAKIIEINTSTPDEIERYRRETELKKPQPPVQTSLFSGVFGFFKSIYDQATAESSESDNDLTYRN